MSGYRRLGNLLALALRIVGDVHAHKLEHALDRPGLAQRHGLALGLGHDKAEAPEHALVERAPVVQLLRQAVRATAPADSLRKLNSVCADARAGLRMLQSYRGSARPARHSGTLC